MSPSRSLADLGEHAAVEMIKTRFAVPADIVGPGDDAAVLAESVMSIDRQREGQHFKRDWLTAEQIGSRALAVALSDLAAMAARPQWAMVSLELPADTEVAWFEELLEGLAGAAARWRCPIVGGDLGKGESVGLVVAVGGRTKQPVLRRGARAGHSCWLFGALGRAGAGRIACERGLMTHAVLAPLVTAYAAPQPLLEWAVCAAQDVGLGAMIDVTDGLALDAGRLAVASGCSLQLDAEALVADVLEAADLLQMGALDLALHGGDDYALLCAVEAANDAAIAALAQRRGVAGRRIGSFGRGAPIVTLRGDGTERRLPPLGWDPFTD